jgi:hypothetical protein
VPAVVYGLLANNALLRIDSADPTAATSAIAITGLGDNETARGIDFRPRTGQLLVSTVTTASAANSVVRTYSVDPLSGAATLIGATAAALAGAGDVATGYDFNPTVDRIRLVNVNDENARLNPNNGLLAGNDTDLTPAATTDIVAVAYDRNFDRANAAIPTTLYAIDRNGSTLALQGGLDGTPSPNGGVITDVGPLGFTLGGAADGGFDIAFDPTDPAANGGVGVALAALTDAADSLTRLYSIDLVTGAATAIGLIGAGSQEVFGLAIVPDGAVVVGSGLGANGDVRILDPDSGALRVAIVPFGGYQGGVRVAAGDVTGDGIADAVVSANAPQGHVKVFDGTSGAQVPAFSFFAYEGFLGTVNVASGDANGDGRADVVTIANGVDGHVKVFSGVDGTLIASFLAYPGFTGNSTVALADFDNDGDDEIVTAAAVNGHVKVFNLDGTLFTGPTGFSSSFLAYDGFLGDLNVAAGDVTGDGVADIVLGTGAGTRGHVKVFSGANGALVGSFLAYPAAFTGGASVGVADVNADGRYEIVVTPGFGLQADITAFDELGTPVGGPRTAFAGFLGGATVGGVRI